MLSRSWADLKIGVLDPADWGTSDSWRKPDPGATKQMVNTVGSLTNMYEIIMS